MDESTLKQQLAALLSRVGELELATGRRLGALEDDQKHVRESLHRINDSAHATSLRLVIIEKQNETIEAKTDEIERQAQVIDEKTDKQTELIQGIDRTVNTHATKLGIAGLLLGVVFAAGMTVISSYVVFRITRPPDEQRIGQIVRDAIKEKP